MIQIYSATNTDYSKNGDITLAPKKAELYAKLNGAWTYNLEQPLDEEGRWKYIQEGAVIKAPSFNGEQLFRINQVKKTADVITATADPIFYDSANEIFITDVRPTNVNGQAALNLLLAPGGGKYTGSSDITAVSTAYFNYRNLFDCINGNESPTFIGRWGGEIYYDNYKIYINKRVGGDYGAEVRYGKNIPVNGFTETIETQDIVTRIYPKAFNGRVKTGTAYVDSPLINNYPKVYAKNINFDNIKLKADCNQDEIDNPGNYPGLIICNNQAALNTQLTNACNEQFTLGIDKPTVSISANMVLLHDIVGYEEYRDLVGVGLGDTIKIRHSLLDITSEARVIDLTYDSLLKGVTAVSLGSFSYNYFQNVTSSMQRVEKITKPNGTVIAEKIEGFIDGALAQLRLQNTIAKKQDVRAILFEDLDPESPTFGAMALGTQGFQISRERTADGEDWVWTTFGTAEGFNANLITAGTLNAININGGTITGTTINGTTINGSTITSTRTYTGQGGITITDTSALYDGKITASSTLGNFNLDISGGRMQVTRGTGANQITVTVGGESGLTVSGGGYTTTIAPGYISTTGTIYAGEVVYANNENLAAFEPGDNVSLYGFYAGHVTNSTKSIDFYVPLPKKPSGSATVSFSSISVRGPSGYVNGSQYITIADFTPTITCRNGGIQIRLTQSTALTNVTNNQPVTVGGTVNITFGS